MLRPPPSLAEEAALQAEMRDILALFGDRLLPRIDHPAFSLSYANRRRVEIARALALQPRLLLLDEPTAGMNESETTEMQGIIGQLKARGLTILLIEHKLDLVMQLSDRVIAMDDGVEIAAGPPEHVRHDPAVLEAYLGHRHLGADDRRRARAGAVSDALLRLHGIDTFYGPVQVHFGLSLEVRPGQIVCLLGGNASGKSTTMKVILGLLQPRAGSVHFDGEDITGLPTPRIIGRGIGSVPEARRLFAAMTVRENLLMGAFTRRDRSAVRRTTTAC